ncbi:Enoyl-(Acyl carrier protein) reductase [Kosakonia oryzendophytica]|uniref:Enoyl-(Acyl carrier protein) reductase n=1 Tax=Kosakonia oryzendophytica TaxID=1005665 RepID=A0A1C3YZF4_9ENTR|nr:SDR family oxidoreductase [Kosakonia oryzendophytica]AMO48092.1 putative oxidoreductase yohF [Enterobacter sp. FY-07]TDT58861.1 NAD(P)-dependent dehydrogenase (short-subunit alcohol dehydrogenase family) [Enterobacter sp. AG5470]WBT59756.1 SDR family oxidoreductase [Kosakonia oryzendophytica]SCB75459.1 Enoyl-(Acyl carrier protein) reductase [Kosakonia oryzendophytica]
MTATKVAIVTAADSGIGKQCALMLAEQGFDIGITWHSDEQGAKETARHVEKRGRRAETIQLDLSQLPQGAQAIDSLIARFGRIDALVNNAGAMSKAPFLDVKFEEWRTIFTVDVDGAFLCSQIAARQMVKQGQGGRIVNITSVHEHTPLPEASAYTAAKHALGGLTKSMALELIEHNILVNAVAPGAIATPMNNMRDEDATPGSMPDIPLARPGRTREIASMVAWLCSDDASYTTGQSMIIDGGFMLANPQFKPKTG